MLTIIDQLNVYKHYKSNLIVVSINKTVIGDIGIK